jgi:hypothetical protein
VLLPTLVHVVVGQGIEPKVMGDSLELHPITVMLCLIFWGMLWGIPGMLLAAPITAAFKIFFESMDTTRPLAKMLAGNLEELMTSVDESDSKDGPKSPRTVTIPRLVCSPDSAASCQLVSSVLCVCVCACCFRLRRSESPARGGHHSPR